jgi:hypothetical protein
MFRQAQALGFPVVPEVYMRTAMSLGVLFAQGATTAGWGRSFRFTREKPGLFGEVICENDDRLIEKCFRLTFINPARSGVEIIVLALEISKQYFKVSSKFKSVNVYHEHGSTRPRRLVFIKADTAPSFDSANTVITISGEFVVNTPMNSPRPIPF